MSILNGITHKPSLISIMDYPPERRVCGLMCLLRWIGECPRYSRQDSGEVVAREKPSQAEPGAACPERFCFAPLARAPRASAASTSLGPREDPPQLVAHNPMVASVARFGPGVTSLTQQLSTAPS